MAKRSRQTHRTSSPPFPVGWDRNRAVALLMQLLSIPGSSGNERAVAKWIHEQLRSGGAHADRVTFDSAHRRTPIRGDTGNLILKLPGTRRGPRLLLSAHMDTVPICVDCRPVRKGNRVTAADATTGLGADDRAGCAVLLHTALEILRGNLPHPPLTFCWTVQEEVGLQGARCVAQRLLGSPRMAFNWDGGSASKLTIGATGGYRLSMKVTGLASHAGNAPEQGISAIAIAAVAIADLQKNGWHGNIVMGSKHGTSNVGFIQGGNATNVVTDHLRIRAEARSHDPRFRGEIVQQFEKAFLRAANSVRNAAGDCGEVTFEERLDYESFLLDSNEPCVHAAKTAIRAIGRECSLAVANGGLDANWWVQHGIPCVSLGCGQKNQHTTNESLDLSEYRDACRIALQLVTETEL